MALTTLTSVKTYLGITGSGDDTLLTQLIDAASAMIEHNTNRKFELDTYFEWLSGGDDNILLSNAPVKNLRVVYDSPTCVMRVYGVDSVTINENNGSVFEISVPTLGGASSSDANANLGDDPTDIKTLIEGLSGVTSVTIDTAGWYGLQLVPAQYGSNGEYVEVEAVLSLVGVSRLKKSTGSIGIVQNTGSAISSRRFSNYNSSGRPAQGMGMGARYNTSESEYGFKTS